MFFNTHPGLSRTTPQGPRAFLRALVYRLWSATCYWGRFSHVPPLESGIRRVNHALGRLL